MKRFKKSARTPGDALARNLLLSFIFAVLPNLAIAQTATLPDQAFERGKALAERNCSRCHAVSNKDKSNHPDAPPFRELLQRYPIDALEEGFVDTIYSNHPDMPVFKVTPEQLGAILEYIASIQSE